MEQFENLKTEEFNKLSSEEKREFVRKLITSDEADVEIHAAFYNPQTKQSVDMKGLVEQLGEEEALDIIMQAIDGSNVNTRTLSQDDIKDLLIKKQKGECTDEELELLDFISHEIMDKDDHLQFQHHWLEITCDLLKFSQDKIKYEASIHDLLTSSYILFSTSSLVSKNGVLSKYSYEDIPLITEMSSQIADDIYDTWKASCKDLPDPELTILALVQLAANIAHSNNIKFSKATDIANGIGISLISEDDDEEENGSNSERICKPTVYKPSSDDEEMRDLLKE